MFLPLFRKHDPDAPLVTAARTGDARAFDALVYRYQGRLTQFIRARLASSIDADDVAQEILVTAWRELPRFRNESRFKTWLFGIALKRCAEASRRHARLRLALGDPHQLEADWPQRDGRQDPFAWALALAERDAVRERLGELSDGEREVLELYYYAELNLREISQLTQVNLSTIKYRFYQAHRRLREALQGRDGAVLEPPCKEKQR